MGLPVRYPELDWEWLMRNAKMRDRQNRVAFILSLASQVAEKRGDTALAKGLCDKVNRLERSRFAAEDTLCREHMTQAERKWLRNNRSPAAEPWNLLTDLSTDQLEHAFL